MAEATRWAAGVEYDGSDYSGWQTQPDRATVQAAVEAALSQVADHPVAVVCSGRTDAGVHACNQVIHFDSSAPRPPRAWVFGANTQLPADVALRWAQPVPAGFHARYGARSRDYRYLIIDGPSRSPLFALRAAYSRYRLDAEAMQRATPALIGEHDFSAFRAAGCQAKTPMRNVHYIRVQRRGAFVVVDIRANAFLHHMVRNIVGSLMAIGRGARPAAWLGQVLDGRDRRAAGATAVAGGLYFLGPDYAPDCSLPDAGEPQLLLPQVLT